MASQRVFQQGRCDFAATRLRTVNMLPEALPTPAFAFPRRCVSTARIALLLRTFPQSQGPMK